MIRSTYSGRRIRLSQWMPILCLSLALVIAVVFAVYFGVQSKQLAGNWDALRQQLEDTQKQLTDTKQQLTDAQQQITDLQGQLTSKNESSDSSGSTGTDNTPTPWDTQASIDPNGPAYQKLYPDFYAPQPYNAETVANKVIYLTFDDGPSDRTDEVLDILKQENVKATFFVLHYKNTEAAHPRLKRIVDEGHTLAIHSYTHQYKTIYASVEAYLEDAYKLFTEIKEATGTTPSLFRCPGGSRNGYNKETSDAILAEMKRRGFVCHDWNLSVEDSVLPYKTAEEMTDFLMSYVGNKTRGVVLMHDAKGRKETVKALPEIIARFRDKGFTFEKLTPDVKPYLLGKK